MLQTKRLWIRPYKQQDEESVYKIINSKEIYRTTLNIPYPYPRDQVGIWLHFTLKNSLYQKGYEWGVFTKEDQYIGNVGIVNIDHIHKNGEITYFIGEDYWNQGYATEAVKVMLDFAFKQLNLERVQGRCMTQNAASLRVMQKCHFKYEGLARHEVLKDGVYQDIYYSAILRDEYLSN